MCIWVCLGYVSGYVFGYVFGYVYGYRVSILREAQFNKCRGLPLLGAFLHHYWDLLFHEAHFNHFLGLIPYLNKFWVLFLYEAHFYYLWVLFLHEAHFYYPWVLFLHEAHLDNSSNFSNFPLTKMETLPQYVALNKFF